MPRLPRLPAPWRRSARRAWPLAAILAAAVLGAAVSLLLRSPPVSASWTGWLNSGLESYADTAGQWNSGDNPVQVALPGDGDRALWLFNDSYYGPVRADGTVSPAAPLVRNTLLLSHGSGREFRVTGTITGPFVNDVPTAPVPPVAGAPPGSWAWPDGAIVTGDAVQAVYTVFALQGPDPLDYVPVANQVVTMPLASLAQPSSYLIQPSSFGEASLTAGCGPGGTGCVQWGVGLVNATSCPPPTGLPACTYIYGERWPAPGDSAGTVVLAVAPRGHLADQGTWWYDTTTGWSRSSPGPGGNLAAPLGRGASFSAGSVYQVAADQYVVLGSGRGGVVAYYARDPRLSAARAVPLFSAPRSGSIPRFLAYQFHVEPAYSSGTSVVLGFSVTSFARDRNGLDYAPFCNVAAYQPQFYSVTLPARAEDASPPQALPPPQLHRFPRLPPTGSSSGDGTCENS